MSPLAGSSWLRVGTRVTVKGDSGLYIYEKALVVGIGLQRHSGLVPFYCAVQLCVRFTDSRQLTLWVEF